MCGTDFAISLPPSLHGFRPFRARGGDAAEPRALPWAIDWCTFGASDLCGRDRGALLGTRLLRGCEAPKRRNSTALVSPSPPASRGFRPFRARDGFVMRPRAMPWAVKSCTFGASDLCGRDRGALEAAALETFAYECNFPLRGSRLRRKCPAPKGPNSKARGNAPGIQSIEFTSPERAAPPLPS